MQQRRFIVQAGVRPVVIVVPQPGAQRSPPVARRLIRLDIGPLTQQRLNEALGLAVGPRRIGARL